MSHEGVMTRAEAIGAVLELLADEAVIVCNGYPSREAFQAADRPTHFYMLGSMGSAAAIGLGVALTMPRRKVVVLDGDGNVLMGLGTLATVGALKPGNLLHVVLDNEVYGSTGNQRTVSDVVRLDQVARSAGYSRVERTSRRDDVTRLVPLMLAGDGPGMLLVKVSAEPGTAGRVALEPEEIARRFIRALS